jgi:hypothetical protein
MRRWPKALADEDLVAVGIEDAGHPLAPSMSSGSLTTSTLAPRSTSISASTSSQ